MASKYIYLAGLGLVADRIIKYLISKTPESFPGVFILDGNFGIVAHLNQEFAWSLPAPNSLVIPLMAAVLVLLLWNQFFIKPINLLWLMVAGAFSNLFDRIIYGGVWDYVAVPWGGIINLADIMIFLSVILLIFYVDKSFVLRRSGN